MNNYPVFYHPDFNLTILSEEEAFHALKVLRLQPGMMINLMDGKGGMACAKISECTKKEVKLDHLEILPKQSKKPTIQLIIAPTKQMERMEWLIEKCTEIGLASIHFIKTSHSERKEIKLERLTKIAISALKQSKQGFLPKINPMVSLDELLNQESINSIEIKLFGSLLAEKTLTYKDIDNFNKSIGIIIGPEGDFTTEETDKLLKMNWLPLSFGDSILRTETAGLVAVSQLSLLQNLNL